MPLPLRQRVLQIVDPGHPSIVKMKALLRTKVWWPGVDKRCREILSHMSQLSVSELL